MRASIPAPGPSRRARLFLALLVAVALPGLAPGAARAQIAHRATLVASLDSAARAHAEHPMVAGISVAVVRGRDTLLMRGYGQVDLEWDVGTPEDASASYEIGSVTKQFTAAAIMQLVEAGKLDLDADFTTYLPDYDTRGHRIPLRRLLDHTSGIKGYTEMPVFGELMVRHLPRDTLVALVEAEPFDFEPGTAQIYNNSAYFLLGLIIEEVSGQTYEEYVQEHLFEPAGMDDSYYCSESAVRERRAHGYDATPAGLIRARYLDHTWPYAAGSLCSTVGDMVRWNRALHGGQVLSAASYQAMITPLPLLDGTPLRYAMGLGLSERNGRRVIAHGGGINGFLTDAAYLPDEELVLVVLQNTAGPQGPGALLGTFTDLILGPRSEPEPVAFEGDLQPLVGEYAGPVRGRHVHLTVAREGDGVVVRWPGQEEGRPLTYLGDGVWMDQGTRVRFVPGADGRAAELRMEQGAGLYVLRRVE